jgi:hypothetical protein
MTFLNTCVRCKLHSSHPTSLRRRLVRFSSCIKVLYEKLDEFLRGAMPMSRWLISIFAVSLCVMVPKVAAQAGSKIQLTGNPRYGPSSTLSQSPEPEEGRMANGSFSDQYFQLNYPLLPGWQEDMKGPIPSVTGYYVLGRLRTQGDLKGTMSIEAQDMFFSPVPIRDAMDASERREQQAAFIFQEVIDRPPQQVRVAGHQFVRLDHTGAPYHHSTFSTVLRCHVVSIEITSRFPEVFQRLEGSLERLSLPDTSDFASGGGPAPVCVKDYVSDATLIRRVDPVMVGPRFTKVPVRFVIDDRGRVKHIHVINALPDQAKSVEDALAQWIFKPYRQNGRPLEVETGIVFQFPPNGQRRTSTASRF